MNLPRYHATEFDLITVCGSMRFYTTMLEVAEKLSVAGYIVLMPFVNTKEGGYKDNGLVKAELDKMHFAKIDLSRGIYVVNGTTPDDTAYTGSSTIREIAYAKRHGKYCRYLVEPLAKENQVDGLTGV